MNDATEKILEVRNLRKVFPIKRSVMDVLTGKLPKSVKAVDDVSLDIYENEIVALVGESGCGKSSFARTVIRLHDPDSGAILFKNQDISKLKRNKFGNLNQEMQMIFQDPYSSLNPRKLIGDILKDELLYHRICAKSEAREKAARILNRVGLDRSFLDRYPCELSGGQRQRIGMARALALTPKFLIMDEPVSALDVSIQAQILNLFQELQHQLGLAILFISHDLSVVRYIADRVAVMYLGKIVESAQTEEIYEHPFHPYTQILIQSAPNLDPRIREENALIEGNPPSPIDLPKGCRFCERCPKAMLICFEEQPELREIGTNHCCACHLR